MLKYIHESPTVLISFDCHTLFCFSSSRHTNTTSLSSSEICATGSSQNKRVHSQKQAKVETYCTQYYGTKRIQVPLLPLPLYVHNHVYLVFNFTTCYKVYNAVIFVTIYLVTKNTTKLDHMNLSKVHFATPAVSSERSHLIY